MFCGQCGRAITAADVAAFQKTQEAEVAGRDGARPEIPAWQLHEPPPAAVPAGTPWWKSGGEGPEAEDDAIDSDESIGDETPTYEAEGRPVVTDPDDDLSAGASAAPDWPARDDGPASEPPADVPAVEVPADAPAAEAPGVGLPDEETIARTPAPLRAPDSSSANGPRPTSAPLWTASLTPITDSGDASPDGDAPNDAMSSDGQGASGQEGTRAPAAEPAAASASGPVDSQVADQDPAPLAAPDEPQPGDTNVIQPLVAPSDARVGGALRCTVCGAALAEDDIFCGECGTVVQSVAQSFTGPITPILTGIVPQAPEPSLPPDEQDDPPYDGRGDGEPPAASATAVVPAAPASAEPAAPPLPDRVEPPAKKRRLFGRRVEQESPQLWSSPAAPIQPVDAPVTPLPPLPPTGVAPEAPATPPAPDPVKVEQVPAAADESGASEPTEAPLAATPVDAPPQRVDSVAVPTPPAPESPRAAIPWAVGAPEDDVEKTRIVHRQPLGEPYVLQFSTGESFTVQGTGLIGRAPTPQPGEAIDLLVRIVDPGKSVSKTHLEFGQESGALWVSDRWSGNGSIVRDPGHEARRCEPGKRVRVSRGARVDIGEQFFIVS
jgi:hypothetical protein